MRISRKVSIIAILSVISLFCALAVVGATYGTDGDINANVNITPSLLVTIPSDTVSLNLNPFASAFGTASLPVTVSTNNPTGFTLNMSASETDLTLVNGSETIPTLADKTGGYSESEFTVNRWGYKLSTATNYSPFALSNELLVTDSPSNASTSTVNFASKVDATKPAGTYELEITFTAVANYVPPADVPTTCQTPVPGITYMQEITDQNKATVMASMTPNQQYYLRDRRDETPYCVSNITTKNANNEDQNAIWMTQNLRITGTISATDSNFTGSDFNVSAYDLKADGASGGACDASNSYNRVCSHAPDANDLTRTNLTAEELGAWYNYVAATAGTITGNVNTTEATKDICPAGWSLPSYDTTKPANSVNSLGSPESSTYVSTFKPVTGGYYYYGSLDFTGYGFWWSTTASDASTRSGLGYSSSSLSIYNEFRNNGMHVRCVRR